MKKAWMLGLAGLLALGSASYALAQQARDSTESAIAALENQWLQSEKTNNPDLVAPLLADKMVETTSEGKFHGRTESLADAKATKYASADYEDVKISVFGDAAIATGGFKGKGIDENGKPFEAHLRWTDTWVKMANGKWQCVATQATPIK